MNYETKLTLALSSLMSFCQELINSGQLNRNVEKDLNATLRMIDRMMARTHETQTKN